jgi:hypothetical protein
MKNPAAEIDAVADAVLAEAAIVGRVVTSVAHALKARAVRVGLVPKVSAGRAQAAVAVFKAVNGAAAVVSADVMTAAADSADAKNGENSLPFLRSTLISFPRRRVSNRWRAKLN